MAGGGQGGMPGGNMGGMRRSYGGPNLQGGRPGGMGQGSPFNGGGMANRFLNPGQSPLMGGQRQGGYGQQGMGQPGGNMGYGSEFHGGAFNPAQGGQGFASQFMQNPQAQSMLQAANGANGGAQSAWDQTQGGQPGGLSPAQMQQAQASAQSMLSQAPQAQAGPQMAPAAGLLGGSQDPNDLLRQGQPGMMYAGGSPGNGNMARPR